MEITLSEFNANPDQFAKSVMKGETTVIDDPPRAKARVQGSNGETLSEEEFDALSLPAQAEFVLGERTNR